MPNPQKEPAPPPSAAGLYLMRATAVAGHYDRVDGETTGPSPDLRAAHDQLAALARDPRIVLLIVGMARRIARLEAALAAQGGAA